MDEAHRDSMTRRTCARSPLPPPKMTHLHREAAATRRLYRRNSSLIPAGVSALLMGITAGSSPQCCRLVAK